MFFDQEKQEEKQRIGDESSFGNVYKLNKYYPPIVVKEILITTDSDDHLDELQTLKELSHENIVKYLDRPSDYPYDNEYFLIFMEYCEYGSLKNVINNPKFIYSIATIAKWASDLFSGLIYLQGAGRVHRDIKPANYVLKIGDFGITKKFENREAIEALAGTEPYMAPEVKKCLRIGTEDTYKRDVYAAGLVLWEIMERDYLAHWLPNNEEISFSFKSSAGVNELQRLITSCCLKNYIQRMDAQAALRMAKEVMKEVSKVLASLLNNSRTLIQRVARLVASKSSLYQSCHNHEVSPFYKKDQQYLTEPIGINGSTKQIPVNFDEKLKKKRFNVDSLLSQAHNTTFLVPDVSFLTKLNSKQQVVDEKPKASTAELISKGNQNILKDILTKVQSETHFHSSIMNDYFSWRIYSDRYWIPTEKITDVFLKIWIPEFILDFEKVNDVNDVNEIRKRLCESFKTEYNLLNDQEKNDFVEHFQANYLRDRKLGPFSLDVTSYPLSIYQNFAALINFDSTIQSFCFQQAFYVLIECQSDQLATFDLLKLIKLAIENIEQLEKIFNRRFYFPTFYLIGSRNEWCLSDTMNVSEERLFFKRNLTDFRRTQEGREGPVDFETNEKSPIDIEALRRALYEQKNVLERYMIAKKRQFPWHLDQRVRSLCKKDVEPGREVYKKFRLKISLTTDLPFPGYFFAFHFWPGLINDGGNIFEKIGGFPKDLDTDLQVSYAQHHNAKQIEFVEMYIRYVKIFFLLNRWKEQDNAPEIIYLLEDLVNDTKGFKDFKFVCLYLANEDYEGLFLERLQHETIIFTREFQMHKTDLIVKDELRILGFVEIKFFDLIEVAKEMIKSFRLLYRAKIASDRKIPEKQLKYLEDCIKTFWKKQKLVLHNSRNHYGKLPVENCQVKSLENIARNETSMTDEIQIVPLLKDVVGVISNVFLGGSKSSSSSKTTNSTEVRDLDLD